MYVYIIINKALEKIPKHLILSSRCIFFVEQVIEVIRHPTERVESGRGSGSGSAPADEERYRELVKENEELQKLIAQVIIFNDIFK